MLEQQPKPKFERYDEQEKAHNPEQVESLTAELVQFLDSEIYAIETEFADFEGEHHEFVKTLRERSYRLVTELLENNETFINLSRRDQISVLQAVVDSCVAQGNNNYRFVVSGVVNNFLHPRVEDERDIEVRFHEDRSSTQFKYSREVLPT